MDVASEQHLSTSVKQIRSPNLAFCRLENLTRDCRRDWRSVGPSGKVVTSGVNPAPDVPQGAALSVIPKSWDFQTRDCRCTHEIRS